MPSTAPSVTLMAVSSPIGGRLERGRAGLRHLPRNTPAPYRLWQLDWSIAQAPNLQWSQEIDRAYVALHLAPAEITVGRQAIGWGRAVLFGAVDLFSPFNALEADREWRLGVDAVRVDVRLAERFSTEVVGAFGPDSGNSYFAGRVRGFAGDVDGELVLGWRAQDLLAGFTTPARLGGAAAHAELAYFRVHALQSLVNRVPKEQKADFQDRLKKAQELV